MISTESPPHAYVLPQAHVLAARLAEPRRFIQVVAGPRQVGKTTMVQAVVEAAGLPHIFASADEPTLHNEAWIAQQWDAARLLAPAKSTASVVLILDEIQKIPAWSEIVKRLWDEDTRARRPVKVVLLGSAPLLISRGLSESLAGRFELIHLRHWGLADMRAAFGWSVEEFIYYGGYPGAAPLISDPARWARYVMDSLIETTISRDVLLLARVDKPALLRQLFELGCRYSGQVLSFTKMLGQLQDAGNATTLSHYLDLLAGAGMLTGLQKYAGDAARSRGSIPKLQVFNTGLISAQSGLTLAEARAEPNTWGRLVESAVGAHLANAAATAACELFYWRERNHEVDFVLLSRRRLVAIEVKSGRTPTAHAGTEAFSRAFRPQRTLLVGGDGIPVEAFLSRPVEDWMRP
jgi:predicted AAA+ superfamily ATPase